MSHSVILITCKKRYGKELTDAHATLRLLSLWRHERFLATYVVDSHAHGTDTNSATTTLVEAIQLANTNTGPDTIVLASGSTYLSDDATFIDGASAGRTMYPRSPVTLLYKVMDRH